VGLNSLKSLNLTNVYPNNNKNNKKKKNNNNNKKNNKVKSKPLELFELAGKNKFPNKNILFFRLKNPEVPVKQLVNEWSDNFGCNFLQLIRQYFMSTYAYPRDLQQSWPYFQINLLLCYFLEFNLGFQDIDFCTPL
jgi:hypothetical protein